MPRSGGGPQHVPEMERLLGQQGGGIDLPPLFDSILLAVHEEQTIDIAAARQAAQRAVGHQFSRMQVLFGDHAPDGDGVAACLRTILDQMTLVKVLQRNGAEEAPWWSKGPAFKLDAPMRIVRDHKGWLGSTLISKASEGPNYDAQMREARERGVAAVRAIAALLGPNGAGIRPVTEAGVEEIKRSVLQHGIVAKGRFKVLRDQYGRTLDGRHRLAVGAALGIIWPEEVVHVKDDAEAVAIAIAANRGRPLGSQDFERLAKLGLDWTGEGGNRHMARIALLENPRRSDNSIAKLVGNKCKGDTVREVRLELETSQSIGKFRATGGRGHTEARHNGGRPPSDLQDRIRAALAQNAQRSNAEVGRALSCDKSSVRMTRLAMEATGEIEVYRSGPGGRAGEAPAAPSGPTEPTTDPVANAPSPAAPTTPQPAAQASKQPSGKEQQVPSPTPVSKQRRANVDEITALADQTRRLTGRVRALLGAGYAYDTPAHLAALEDLSVALAGQLALQETIVSLLRRVRQAVEQDASTSPGP